MRGTQGGGGIRKKEEGGRRAQEDVGGRGAIGAGRVDVRYTIPLYLMQINTQFSYFRLGREERARKKTC